jgi:branched-chain amino acid aminotransferase
MSNINVAYLNGSRIDNLNIISLYNPSFLYGINVFEGIRSYFNGDCQIVFDLDEHLIRLFESISFIGFNFDISKNSLKTELISILEKEKINTDVYIRITIFLGSDSSWSDINNVQRLISIRSLNSNLDNLESTTMSLTSIKRISSDAMPPFVKAGANYLNSRYALLEAKSRGYEGALFTSNHNFISESTGSCIFFIKNHVVYTPSVDCDILVGVTRNRIIKLCEENDIEVNEIAIPSTSLFIYDAAFLAGTMIELKPIDKIDQKNYNTINNKVFLKILKLFKEYVYSK